MNSGIDIDKLREELQDICYAGAFGVGLDEMLIDAIDLDDATPEEIILLAKEYGLI